MGDGIDIALFILVSVVIVLRLPAVRSPEQRPLWLMLVVLVTGMIAAMPSVAAVINRVSDVPQLANLIRGLSAVALATALLHLAVHLQSAERTWGRLRFGLAAITVIGQITCFSLAIMLNEPLRPGFQPTPGQLNFVMGYWFFFLPYMIGARFTSAVLFWRLLPRMRSLLPRVGILLLALATTVSLAYLASRVGNLFSAAPFLRDIGFVASFSSFVLLTLGASLAAIAPLRQSIVDWWYCRQLYPLWHDLCTAFPHFALQPARTRLVDALTLRNTQTRLHRRLVETRDGLLTLREWITPEDLEQIRSAVPDATEETITVLWVRRALRAHRAGLPKSPVVLDLVRHGGTDTETELRWLRALAKAYRTEDSEPLTGTKDSAHVQ